MCPKEQYQCRKTLSDIEKRLDWHWIIWYLFYVWNYAIVQLNNIG